MLAKMWRKRNTPPLLVGLQAGTALSKPVWRFLRKLDPVLPKNPVIPFLDIYPEDTPSSNKETCSTIYVHSSHIYNSQKLGKKKKKKKKTTQMSLKRGKDTENVVYLQNRIELSYYKQELHEICTQMDGS
jgi:hypothetical protein